MNNCLVYTNDIIKYVIITGLMYTIIKIFPTIQLNNKDLSLTIIIIVVSIIFIDSIFNNTNESFSNSCSQYCMNTDGSIQWPCTTGTPQGWTSDGNNHYNDIQSCNNQNSNAMVPNGSSIKTPNKTSNDSNNQMNNIDCYQQCYKQNELGDTIIDPDCISNCNVNTPSITSAPTMPTNVPTMPTNVPTTATNVPTMATNMPTMTTNTPTMTTNMPTMTTNTPTNMPTNKPTITTNTPVYSSLLSSIFPDTIEYDSNNCPGCANNLQQTPQTQQTHQPQQPPLSENQVVTNYYNSLITELSDNGILDSSDVSNINSKLQTKLLTIYNVIQSLEQLKKSGIPKSKNDMKYNELPNDFYSPIGDKIANEWDNSYTILNTNKWQVPIVRPPLCINNNPCKVCPSDVVPYGTNLGSWDDSRVVSNTVLNKKWTSAQTSS